MEKLQEWIADLIARLLRLRIVRAAMMFSDHSGGLLAAAITFRALFAVFAAVLLGFSVASIWLSSRDDLWDALVEIVDNVIPGLIGGENALIKVDDLQNGMTAAGIASVVALVMAMLGAVGNLRESLRVIAGTQQTSSALITKLWDLLFALSLGVLLAASAVATFLGSTFVTTVLSWIGGAPGGTAEVLTRILTVLVTFLLDAVIIAWLFWLLSGVKTTLRTIVPGALLGGFGLVVLQQLSSLFVGGATNNPLLASFASLIALLLWFNFSAQVILIASAYIVVSEEERQDRIGERYGAATMPQRAVRAAERDLRVAEDALRLAREAERDAAQKQRERAERRASQAPAE
ncbi:YhjD/YihY/BrkB family envelope integrity protein [Microbacterium sp. gxy059]|uniref:YhjD/YihY/BrkB family envelope integrity protein n=1 Tax=Microbacterium sp. gxy059 TaxID=2957199 RepID=UPI003D96DF01